MVSDLISRSDLLTRMCQENCGERQCVDAMDRCVWYYCIKQQPTVDRWIPCSERLPEDETDVLVQWGEYADMSVARLSEGIWYIHGIFLERISNPEVITAWMPLPEPYKAGDIDG